MGERDPRELHIEGLAWRFTGLIPPGKRAACEIVEKICSDAASLAADLAAVLEREQALKEALGDIRDRSVCVIRGSIVSKHSGRFCAHHVASNALAVSDRPAGEEAESDIVAEGIVESWRESDGTR